MARISKPDPIGTPQHFRYLDGWRGIAIALLLIGHFLPAPGINLGTVGVNLFFVLSGLLMARLLFIQEIGLAKFYRRRISRIIPAHIAYITTITIAWILSGKEVSPRKIFSALFFINNYVTPAGGPGTATMPLGHIWSLSVEEHSYIVLSIIAVASHRRLISKIFGVGPLVAICIFFCFSYSIQNPPNILFVEWLHTETAAFGVMLSAFLVVLFDRTKRDTCWKSGWIPSLLAIGFMLHWWSVPITIQRILGVGCLALAINLLPHAAPFMLRCLSWAPLCKLDTSSFSLYMWQQPFYLWVHQGQLSPAAGLALALAFGLTSHLVIEQPARRYLNNHWGTKGPSTKS